MGSMMRVSTKSRSHGLDAYSFSNHDRHIPSSQTSMPLKPRTLRPHARATLDQSQSPTFLSFRLLLFIFVPFSSIPFYFDHSSDGHHLSTSRHHRFAKS